MAVAMLYPEPEKLKRKGAGSVEITELSSGYISEARTILAHAPKLVDQVLTNRRWWGQRFVLKQNRGR